MSVTWDVVNLDATKTVGSLSDVVTHIHWTVSDSETVGSGESAVVHSSSNYGTINLAEPDGESFIAYADITKDNAIAWAKNAIGSDEVARIEAGIAESISESKTPTKISGVPW